MELSKIANRFNFREPVTAIQWTGENQREIVAAVGDLASVSQREVSRVVGTSLYLYLNLKGRSAVQVVVLKLGSWLVRLGGWADIMTDEVFQETLFSAAGRDVPAVQIVSSPIIPAPVDDNLLAARPLQALIFTSNWDEVVRGDCAACIRLGKIGFHEGTVTLYHPASGAITLATLQSVEHMAIKDLSDDDLLDCDYISPSDLLDEFQATPDSIVTVVRWSNVSRPATESSPESGDSVVCSAPEHYKITPLMREGGEIIEGEFTEFAVAQQNEQSSPDVPGSEPQEDLPTS